MVIQMNFFQHKKIKDVVDDFLDFIKDKKLVIHNASFDLAHLNNELSLIGREKIDESVVIDTLKIAREKFPGSQISLDALCKRYKIDNSKRKKHNAIIDCELLNKVYVNLIDQKEPLLNFQSNEINEINKENNNIVSYSKKIIKPTEEEIQLHKLFFKSKLKKNFFN